MMRRFSRVVGCRLLASHAMPSPVDQARRSSGGFESSSTPLGDVSVQQHGGCIKPIHSRHCAMNPNDDRPPRRLPQVMGDEEAAHQNVANARRMQVVSHSAVTAILVEHLGSSEIVAMTVPSIVALCHFPQGSTSSELLENCNAARRKIATYLKAVLPDALPEVREAAIDALFVPSPTIKNIIEETCPKYLRNSSLVGRKVLVDLEVRRTIARRDIPADFVPMEEVSQRLLSEAGRLAVLTGESGAGKTRIALAHRSDEDSCYVYLLAGTICSDASGAFFADYGAVSYATTFIDAVKAWVVDPNKSTTPADVNSVDVWSLVKALGELSGGNEVGELLQKSCEGLLQTSLAAVDLAPPQNVQTAASMFGAAYKKHRDECTVKAVLDAVRRLLPCEPPLTPQQGVHVTLVVDEIGGYPTLLRSLAATHQRIAADVGVMLGVSSVSLVAAGTGADWIGHGMGSSPSQYAEIPVGRTASVWEAIKKNCPSRILSAMELRNDNWAALAKSVVGNARVAAAFVQAAKESSLLASESTTIKAIAAVVLPYLVMRAVLKYRSLNGMYNFVTTAKLNAAIGCALALHIASRDCPSLQLSEDEECVIRNLGIVTDAAFWSETKRKDHTVLLAERRTSASTCAGGQLMYLLLETGKHRFQISAAQLAMARWVYGSTFRAMTGDAFEQDVVDWLYFMCIIASAPRAIPPPSRTWLVDVCRLQTLLRTSPRITGVQFLPPPLGHCIAPTRTFLEEGLEHYLASVRAALQAHPDTAVITRNTAAAPFADILCFVGNHLLLIQVKRAGRAGRGHKLTEMSQYQELYKMGLRTQKAVCAQAADDWRKQCNDCEGVSGPSTAYSVLLERADWKTTLLPATEEAEDEQYMATSDDCNTATSKNSRLHTTSALARQLAGGVNNRTLIYVTVVDGPAHVPTYDETEKDCCYFIQVNAEKNALFPITVPLSAEASGESVAQYVPVALPDSRLRRIIIDELCELPEENEILQSLTKP